MEGNESLIVVITGFRMEDVGETEEKLSEKGSNKECRFGPRIHSISQRERSEQNYKHAHQPLHRN